MIFFFKVKKYNDFGGIQKKFGGKHVMKDWRYEQPEGMC